MKRLLRRCIEMLPVVGRLYRQVGRQGLFPAGHYYSPIPDRDDVHAYVTARTPPPLSLPGIDLDDRGQLDLLDDYSRYYADLPFPEKQRADCRYYYDNDFFSYSDAIFLYAFLRHFQPRRIVEVGSGFSSAVMLDTVERFFPERPGMVFVEPYPERLQALLRGGDEAHVEVQVRKVQDVPAELFLSLAAGDFLFIDSSHVVKCGSDLHWLFFEVLPNLRDGVFVHFHDVFYPFDYPGEWLEQGRYWNENYFLRAFLYGNTRWRIRFFNTYMALAHGGLIGQRMPLCARNPGGSLYLQKTPGGRRAAASR